MYTREYLKSLFDDEQRKYEDAYVARIILQIRDQVLYLAKLGKTTYAWNTALDKMTPRQLLEIHKGLYVYFPDSRISRILNGIAIDWYC